MMTCSGSDAAIVLARLIALSGPGSAGGMPGSARTGAVPAATRSASSSSAPSTSWLAVGQGGDRAAGRHQVAGLAGVGEERHRRARPGQDQVRDPGQLGLGRSRPGRPAGRRKAARRLVPSGPGTSRPAAGPRSRRRPGWPPAARARSGPARRGRASSPVRLSRGWRSSIVESGRPLTSGGGCLPGCSAGWWSGGAGPGSRLRSRTRRPGGSAWRSGRPGRRPAPRIASWARSRGWPLVCTQPDTVRARASMSDCSGAS